jgi:hypothetical protein
MNIQDVPVLLALAKGLTQCAILPSRHSLARAGIFAAQFLKDRSAWTFEAGKKGHPVPGSWPGGRPPGTSRGFLQRFELINCRFFEKK